LTKLWPVAATLRVEEVVRPASSYWKTTVPISSLTRQSRV
jgi:hypothetical protein